MTHGPIFAPLVKFTIPLILGQILQLTYNAVDGVIAGRCIGPEALAAIGTSNPVMTLILLFTNGLCLGSGLLASNHFGAKDAEALQRQIWTGFCAGAVFSALVAALIFLGAPLILTTLYVDKSILYIATNYLRITTSGLVFSFAYGYFASMLRALGDSASPLFFLSLSAALNIAGDILLVVVLNLGTNGAAISTAACECLSAILCGIYIYVKFPIFRIRRGLFRIDIRALKQTLSYGITSAMQQSSVQAGKLVIQGFVNTLGVSGTAAFSAVNRTDDFAIVPEQNIAHAMSTMMAQNEGAGLENRVNLVFKAGLMLELGFGLSVGLALFFAARPVMMFFTKDPAVLDSGAAYLRLIAFMYPLPAFTNCIQGYFRGIGDMKITLVSSVLNMAARCGAAWAAILIGRFTFSALPWSYFAGWAAMCAFEVPLLLRKIRARRIVS